MPTISIWQVFITNMKTLQQVKYLPVSQSLQQRQTAHDIEFENKWVFDPTPKTQYLVELAEYFGDVARAWYE